MPPRSSLPSAFMFLSCRPSRPSDFMSLPPFMWSSVRWFFSAPIDFCSDCVDFMSDLPPLSRCIVPDEGPPRSEEGALCCAVEPADPESRPMPVPCAFAKPVPAIRAAVATEIEKRLVIECLLNVSALPDRQRKEFPDVPVQ